MLRDEMNDLRNAEVHEEGTAYNHGTKLVPDPQLGRSRMVVPPGAEYVYTPVHQIGVSAPTLSAPDTWADGREVLEVCDEYLRLVGDFVRACEEALEMQKEREPS